MFQIHPEGWYAVFRFLRFDGGDCAATGVSLTGKRVAPRIAFGIVPEIHDEFSEMHTLLLKVIPQHRDMILNKLSDLLGGNFNGCFDPFRRGYKFYIHSSKSGRVDDDACRVTPFSLQKANDMLHPVFECRPALSLQRNLCKTLENNRPPALLLGRSDRRE